MATDTESLDDFLARGKPPARVAAQIAANLARYLSSMHSAGKPYLRLSPRTVFVDRGCNVHLDASAGHGLADGDPAYRAPEQIRGEEADWRTDAWGVGALFYRMWSGQDPFWGGSTAELEATILRQEPAELALPAGTMPREVERVLNRCLAKSPVDRYETTHDLVKDLDAVCRTMVSRAPGLGGVPTEPHPVRRTASPERLSDDVLGNNDLVRRVQSRRSRLTEREPASWWSISALPAAALLLLVATLLYCGIGRQTQAGEGIGTTDPRTLRE